MAFPSETPNKILLVESPDDEHVVKHLHHREGLSLDFSIKSTGDIVSLLSSISVEMKAPGRIAVGVMADADASVASRWREISTKFEKAGVTLPRQPGQGGVVVSSRPKVGVWLMPDNLSNGELEDFLRVQIPQNDVVWPLTNAYIGSIPAHLQPRKCSKALVRAWLAGKPEYLLMGAAIGKGEDYFDTSHPLAKSIVGWLDRLFK